MSVFESTDICMSVFTFVTALVAIVDKKVFY